MNRAAYCWLIAVVGFVGCQGGPEALKIPPLPIDGPAATYTEVVHRARLLATSATEAFYVDKWPEVEAAAQYLEQTALYLPKAGEIPAARRGSVESNSQALAKDAVDLREAAKKTDEKRTNAALQRVHLRVRELRPE